MSLHEKDERKIIERILCGHADEFSFFVDRYGGCIFSLVAKIVAVQEDAEEIVQDTFLVAYTHLADYNSSASFSTWLYRIAYNKAVSHLRKVRPKVYLDDTAVDLVDDSDADRALRIETDERLKLLEQAVDKLPPDDKMLVVLYHLEERTAGDVAYIMGMTEQNVRTRLHRVRKKLYLLMKENMNDEKR